MRAQLIAALAVAVCVSRSLPIELRSAFAEPEKRTFSESKGQCRRRSIEAETLDFDSIHSTDMKCRGTGAEAHAQVAGRHRWQRGTLSSDRPAFRRADQRAVSRDLRDRVVHRCDGDPHGGGTHRGDENLDGPARDHDR